MILVMSWFCLRMHAGYRCRHAGVCCRADWEIPAETHVLTAVDRSSTLRESTAGLALMDGLHATAELLVPRDDRRTCLFYEPRASGSCAIHREAGQDALPSACRHFPRELLVDPRGTFVSLSHYCPTAAALLTTPDGLDIVEARPPLRIGGPIDALDATEALPPLLRPGLLTDLDSYAAWEAEGLAILSRHDLTATAALARIDAMTEQLRRGQTRVRPSPDRAQTEVRPGSDLAQTSVEAGSDLGLTPGALAHGFAPLIAQHIPEDAFPISEYETRWAHLVEGSPEIERVMKNYLAARLFATWIAYQSRGLRTIVEWLRTCHAVLRNEIALRCMGERRNATVDDALAAAGRADLLMVHTIDSSAFARFFHEREGA
jgi:hypothetical protein